MIQPNDVTLVKPYALNRVRFMRQFYNFAEDRSIKNSPHNLSDYKSILGLLGSKQFKPNMFRAILNLQENNMAIDNGLRADPREIIAPIPVDENLPVDIPLKTQIPAQNAANSTFERWKLTNKLAEDFKEAKTELKEKMFLLLPPTIFNSLVAKGGIEGWSNVTPEMVFDYVLGNDFAHLTEGEVEAAQAKISRPWDRKLTLLENMEAMEEANKTLGDSFPHLKLDDQHMFRVAYTIAKSPNYRLAKTVESFMTPDQHFLTSLYSVFSKYLLDNYRNKIHTEDNGHLAFVCEDGYKENTLRPYALAAVNNGDDGGLALAANALPKPLAAKANPSTFKPGEYEEYLQLKAKHKLNPTVQTSKVPPRPPNAPAGAKFGKICFNCGWNAVHNSKNCPVMFNDPKFSKAMKSLTQFDPKIDPHTIGGIPVNQTCAPGIYGNY